MVIILIEITIHKYLLVHIYEYHISRTKNSDIDRNEKNGIAFKYFASSSIYGKYQLKF